MPAMARTTSSGGITLRIPARAMEAALTAWTA